MMNPILYKAAAEGNTDVLIRQNADQLEVQVTPNNNTLLHVAAQFGHTHCVREILRKCGRSLLCSVNIEGDTSLHISAREGYAGVVQALIEYAKELDKELESGTGTSKEMLRMRNVEGDIALHEAVRNEKNLDVVVILTKEDSEFVHQPNNAEETPLFLAAERNYPKIVSKILENCTSPAYSGPNGRTALHAAIINYFHQDCTEILLQWNPSLIKEADVFGWRPLHYAAWFGGVGKVRQLLDLDKSMAYLVAEKDGNNTALHIAASQGHIDVVKGIISHCPDCWEMINSKGQNILHLAVENDEEKIIKFILTSSFSRSLINQKDIHGNTPLHLIGTKYGTVYQYGLVQHPRVDIWASNKENLTPLEVRGSMHTLPVAGSCRNKFKLRSKMEDFEKSRKLRRDISKIGDTQLIVATLIATVTFAAGFTLPGGYDGTDGPKQGMAVLTKQAAFKAFVLTDTIAMVFSATAVFFHLFASIYKDEDKRLDRYYLALIFILAAMVAMVVAFMTGFYVVLPHLSGLAITVCVICCCFFPIAYFVLRKTVRDFNQALGIITF